MADGFHFVERADDAVFGVGQCLHHQFDARRVIGDGLVQFERRFADGFVGQVAFGEPDALDETFGEKLARCGLHVDDLVFDRRRAAVQNHDNHIPCVF